MVGREMLVREPCPNCCGVGVVQHLAWVEFENAHQMIMSVARMPDAMGRREWFANHGYPDEPPYEVDCPHCKGLGFVERWMPVAEVME